MKLLKRQVLINTSLIQNFGSDRSFEIEEKAEGVLVKTHTDSSYIFYKSFVNDEDITTTVKIYKDSVSLIRVGDYHSKQVFTKENWSECSHHVSGRSLILKSFTKRLEHFFEKDGGSLNLLYDLWTGQSLLGHFCFDLVIF